MGDCASCTLDLNGCCYGRRAPVLFQHSHWFDTRTTTYLRRTLRQHQSRAWLSINQCQPFQRSLQLPLQLVPSVAGAGWRPDVTGRTRVKLSGSSGTEGIGNKSTNLGIMAFLSLQRLLVICDGLNYLGRPFRALVFCCCH